MRQSETGLFLPYRAFGEICSAVKPAYEQIAGEKFQGIAYCPIGNIVCVYTFEPFRLIFVTKPLSFDIHSVKSFREYMFAANENYVSIYKQVGKEFLRDIVIENFPKLMMPFAEVLIVVDNANVIQVFDFDSGKKIVEIESPTSFSITALVHPITYVNQIVAGGSDGRMRLLDLEGGSLVREFPSDENFNCAITVLEQSPAVDVLGIGMANGRIHLKNIKVDQTICTFRQDGSITAMAFRTDGIDSLVTGNSDGSLAVWDLNEKILIGQKTDVHQGPVVSLCFLVGQSFVISSGQDNRLVKWVIKDEYSLPELRKVLEGPSCRSLLVASKDGCLRQISSYDRNNMKHFGAAREVRRKDLGRDRFIDVRLPPILQMCINKTREACLHGVHENLVKALTLSLFNFFKKIRRYSSGQLDVFNMQSGKYQRSFWYAPVSEKTDENSDVRAHSSSITGLALDIMNENLVSGSSDGSIHFWSFNPPKLISRMLVASGVSKFCLDRYNSLLAVALENGELAIVDILCRRVARIFKNAHNGCKLTALEFSPDGRWLVSADDRCVLKVWDLATSSLLDVMKCPYACLDVSFNETGQYLVTCHQGMRAVYFWPTRICFTQVFLLLSFLTGLNHNLVDEEDEDEMCQVVLIDEEEEENSEIHSLSSYSTLVEENEPFVEKRQIEPHLLSLSGLAPSRWSNLPNLNLIRERNKPVAPPKKQENEETEKRNRQEPGKTLMAKRKLVDLETPWVRSLLNSQDDSKKIIDVFVALKEMNVSSIDFQIRALDIESFVPFLNMLVRMLELRQDFELVQSYLATFLNIHHERLWSYEEMELKDEEDQEDREECVMRITERMINHTGS
uniref:Small-subunit processome Utp21 domain-containing protein n=1 Tax=Ditylenchus dipsaci TaxID=166011 RepID=A0A915E894_9BILA